jgi:hypothetical protein
MTDFGDVKSSVQNMDLVHYHGCMAFSFLGKCMRERGNFDKRTVIMRPCPSTLKKFCSIGMTNLPDKQEMMRESDWRAIIHCFFYFGGENDDI